MAYATTMSHAELLSLFLPSAPMPINSVAFAKRNPSPGRPSYFEAIKYIDGEIRYVDPLSYLFISPLGELCFHIRPDYPVIYGSFYKNW
jgi:hypothetical protein